MSKAVIKLRTKAGMQLNFMICWLQEVARQSIFFLFITIVPPQIYFLNLRSGSIKLILLFPVQSTPYLRKYIQMI